MIRCKGKFKNGKPCNKKTYEEYCKQHEIQQYIFSHRQKNTDKNIQDYSSLIIKDYTELQKFIDSTLDYESNHAYKEKIFKGRIPTQLSKVVSDEICNVCLAKYIIDIDTLLVPLCGHCICRECIENLEKDGCPTCGKVIDITQLRELSKK